MFYFFSSDNTNNANTDPLNISSQTPPSEEVGSAGTTKRSFAALNENSEEANVGTVGSTPTGGDDEFRRKKRKDETNKEGKATTQRNTSNYTFKVVLKLTLYFLQTVAIVPYNLLTLESHNYCCHLL